MALFHNSGAFIVTIALVIVGAIAWPECSGPGSEPLFGGKDPETCSAPLDPRGHPAAPVCGFELEEMQGVWYQQYSSSATELARSFQQGQSCIVSTYTVDGQNFSVRHQAQISESTVIDYYGYGSAYAIVNFPGKLSTYYPSSPELFPPLTYTLEGVTSTIRPQYVVRRPGNNQWVILSDFQCETFFVLSKKPVPTALETEQINNATNTLGHGWENIVPTVQGAGCWYENPSGPRATTAALATQGTTSSGNAGALPINGDDNASDGTKLAVSVLVALMLCGFALFA